MYSQYQSGRSVLPFELEKVIIETNLRKSGSYIVLTIVNDIIIRSDMNNQGRPQSLKETIKKLSNLNNFRTLQFVAEFLFFSKYGEESPVFQEFLVVTEMVKFILKLVEYHRSYRDAANPTNIFLEKNQLKKTGPSIENEPLKGNQMERIKQMLKRIKEANWSKNDFQPEMF